MKIIDNFLDLLLDNAKKLFYPEEWVSLDLTLSKTEVFCLLWMERNTDITMTKIADLLDIPMSTTTGVVNRLVKKGYIERYRDENDRRIVLIRLTENGVMLVQEVKQNAAHYFSLVTEALSEEEKAFLLQIFQKIMNHIATSQQKTEEKVSTPKMKNIPIE
ncbi:MarR family transcriptional regulator [Bacillus cereus]|uniref:MarR family transcriptional regulator n=2 Tax=Bacillus cereus group TaxID=86661 RepID=A0AB34D166_BACCE|nr:MULTISPECIES: MarR family transcriptional regulator [Bacillus cereus group]KAB2493092.1 MarR family transcriptional regulator [Bacillus cereus]MBG9531374.1 MarR family transcriptional regulator [Bacillus thuringiensis]MCU5025362.1 MarR family transcriptional regulator [Bacillus cereus]MCU5645208.1 MarR family transcriptional regulator [Bacillus cereus]MDA1972661.1 MarR family transcriptional regulator [Bacillus cereus]